MNPDQPDIFDDGPVIGADGGLISAVLQDSGAVQPDSCALRRENSAVQPVIFNVEPDIGAVRPVKSEVASCCWLLVMPRWRRRHGGCVAAKLINGAAIVIRHVCVEFAIADEVETAVVRHPGVMNRAADRPACIPDER